MAQSVTILTASSTGVATTGVLVLNPVAKSTTVTLTSSGTFAAGSSAATVQIDLSLGDPTTPGGQTLVWAALSSATSIAASAVQATPLTYTVLSPIGAVRVNSPTGSSGAQMSFTLQALQSVTA